MNLDLLTIANRARLGTSIQSSINNSKNRIDKIRVIVDKIESSDDFDEDEKKQEIELCIIDIMSILEQQMSDMLYQIYVSYPSKLGKKQFEITDLQEKGSLLELFYDKATLKILDLAYGRFDKFVDSFLNAFDISSNQLDPDLVADINEIKCTRDCLIHSNGKATGLYMSKAGKKARVSSKGDMLCVDMAYFDESVRKVLTFISVIESLIPNQYKVSNKAYVFKQMWDATCLHQRYEFEEVWEINSPQMISPIDISDDRGFSTSELEVYNLFRYAFGGDNKYKVDFALLFERWEPNTNEYQIAMSWLNNQFFF